MLSGHHFSVSHDTEDLSESSMGTDVSGATLGIIGMGRIGYKVARRASAFDMKILYYNRNQRYATSLSVGCQVKYCQNGYILLLSVKQ